jgi:hypothetical protein
MGTTRCKAEHDGGAGDRSCDRLSRSALAEAAAQPANPARSCLRGQHQARNGRAVFGLSPVPLQGSENHRSVASWFLLPAVVHAYGGSAARFGMRAKLWSGLLTAVPPGHTPPGRWLRGRKCLLRGHSTPARELCLSRAGISLMFIRNLPKCSLCCVMKIPSLPSIR